MSTENKSETVLSPLDEKLVKELVSEGREKGFITIDEINENLGDESPSPEQLERIFDIFSEMDIEIIDSDKKIFSVVITSFCAFLILKSFFFLFHFLPKYLFYYQMNNHLIKQILKKKLNFFY